MNVFKPLIGLFCLTLFLFQCNSEENSSKEDTLEMEVDTIVEVEETPPAVIDPLILGIWKLGNSALNGEIMKFQAENSGLKTLTFYEDGRFEEHQVIENEMVVGDGTFSMDENMLETAIETDEEPLVVAYTLERLTADSMVLKGVEELGAFMFYYTRAE